MATAIVLQLGDTETTLFVSYSAWDRLEHTVRPFLPPRPAALLLDATIFIASHGSSPAWSMAAGSMPSMARSTNGWLGRCNMVAAVQWR